MSFVCKSEVSYYIDEGIRYALPIKYLFYDKNRKKVAKVIPVNKLEFEICIFDSEKEANNFCDNYNYFESDTDSKTLYNFSATDFDKAKRDIYFYISKDFIKTFKQFSKSQQ